MVKNIFGNFISSDKIGLLYLNFSMLPSQMSGAWQGGQCLGRVEFGEVMMLLVTLQEFPLITHLFLKGQGLG